MKHCCYHCSKRIEVVLYDFTIVAAGVETEQVCNPFAQRSHHVPGAGSAVTSDERSHMPASS